MSDRYRAAPACPLELRTGAEAPVATQLVELDLEIDDAGACMAEATLELTHDGYARCMAEGLLGLDAPGRGPGPEPEPGAPVRIVARLRPHLAALVAHEPDPMEALLTRLLAPPAALAHTDAWRALDVTQEIAPGLALGYRTGWTEA